MELLILLAVGGFCGFIYGAYAIALYLEAEEQAAMYQAMQEAQKPRPVTLDDEQKAKARRVAAMQKRLIADGRKVGLLDIETGEVFEPK